MIGFRQAAGSDAPVEQRRAQDRNELERLAEQQAALRRVATLVARGASAAEVFASVAEEVTEALHLGNAAVCRYDDGGTAITVMAVADDRSHRLQAGTRWAFDGPSMCAEVFRTGRAARFEDYRELESTLAAEARMAGFERTAGAPIVVDGSIWGVITTSSPDQPFADDIEDRLAAFTELVATAIANAATRDELRLRSEEQAALRRVATLVARGVPPSQVLDAVAAEVVELLGADWAGVHRYDADGAVTVLASRGDIAREIEVGSRMMLDPESVSESVKRTGRSTWRETFDGVPGESAALARKLARRSAVGAPIVVEGRLWGVVIAAWGREGAWPVAAVEDRMANFTELVAAAIANTESRAELDASRARIVAATDATRRRIERDLHDGAQQQLLSLALELRAAQAAMPPGLEEHRAELAHVAEGLTSVVDGLREIALGLHPAILAEGGLGPALKTLARRSAIPVELDVRVSRRLPEPVEVAAYYVVSEALTNAAKHAQAFTVRVAVEERAGTLHVAVRDDGRGGADPTRGSGLLGLKDRADAIGGTLSLESSLGAGTLLVVELPLGIVRRALR